MHSTTAIAHPRVGLLGNPSDGYGGSTLGFTFGNFQATVRLAEARGVVVDADGHARGEAFGWGELVAGLPGRVAATGRRPPGPGMPLAGGAALQAAAVARFADHCEAKGRIEVLDTAGFALSFDSDIPLQCGLAGSSAIVIATLRALSERFGVAFTPFELSESALLAETEDLGIAAGPQDRVIQAYQGLLFMDFARGRAAKHYRRLAIDLLPPMFVAWNREPGESSGKLHDDVRRRFEAGEPAVVRALQTFPRLAAEGVQCLQRGDHACFRELVDANFDTRASIWPLRDQDVRMVQLGRAHGAAVKFSGSGGAVVGVLPDEAAADAVQRAYEDEGFGFLRPLPVDAPGATS